MGANCCAAAKNTSLQGTNLNQSPPWSFRWDNRTHVEDLAANHSQHSHRRKGNSDSKLAAAAETDGLSDKGSSSSPCPSTASQTQQLHRSPINIRVSWKYRDDVGEVTSSDRKETRSFGNDKKTSISSRMRQSIPASPDRQECKICNDLVTKKSSWSFQREAPAKGPCVVAVLFCGHVYHAECLEKLTPETDAYDPPCPVCIHGKHFNSRLVGNAKSGASGKISRIVVVDNNGVDGDMISEYQRSAGKVRRIGMNSSKKKMAFRKHFMGHLSLKRKFQNVNPPGKETSD
ncbi:uncharacterized protein LOC121997855 [Zingiber officinale]|uniref:uncharacterized protein LOC121997855 n=1 Tax=Zingiber officinale TaxID=94328 RepID=UPI001C4AD039|nr:uncharacterized protein LOC121997855 [Zingiber officinale]XP_042408448.1 uncharacterized protein LOC121997855 [Zingiber officinale]XP_042408449.1 uncharacterized protein LOC121997855 [Zingiber officinale]XP_042408450.1 uncharacterized protein LOC121997855 [Zingiber officinale]